MINPNLKSLKAKIKNIPDLPGIYKYFDDQNTIIYIGKAKNLKKRVSSYFNKTLENGKTSILVSKIFDIDFTVVNTEIDALLLENSLIKAYKPKYNINLKDDKTYPYIKIINEAFPRIIVTRNYIKDGSEYFGPYGNVPMMNMTLELVKKLYPIRNCNLDLSDKNIELGKFKICLEYQIGNCKGPCEKKETKVEYEKKIIEIKSILKGNIHEVKQILNLEMQNAALALKYEEAQKYKQKIDLLKHYQSKSMVVNPRIDNVDVFSIFTDLQISFINYLKISKGIIIQSQTIEIKKKLDETDDQILEYAIAELRNKFNSTANIIIIPIPISINDQLIKFIIPKVGDYKTLLDLSIRNLMNYRKIKLEQNEKLNPDLKTDRILTTLKNELRLNVLPHYMECFDNSNIQGSYPVSSCVVFKDAKPSKKDYRHYIPTTVEGPDDFKTMKEVIYRRFKRLKDEMQPYPDLLIIDGGKGQLSSVCEVLKELDVYGKFQVIGIAKKLEELFFPEDPIPLLLSKKAESLKVLQHIRNEAHRFGITHHRDRRSKGSIKSELDSIKGIGPVTKKLLLIEYKTISKIKETSFESISKLIGTSKATIVKSYFDSKIKN